MANLRRQTIKHTGPAAPASPFIAPAIALGKLFQDFEEIQGKAVQEEVERLRREAADHFKEVYALEPSEPSEPIDVLILSSLLRELVLAISPEKCPTIELVRSNVEYIHGFALHIEKYITDATGVTLVAHGVNLTSEPWN